MKKILTIVVLLIGLIVIYTVTNQHTNDEITPDTSPSQNIDTEDDASVIVDTPLANAAIASPLSIQGKARGYWFFEASFPVEVVDSNGTVLGGGIAQAGGEWMTEEYVPFTAMVTFSKATTTKGYLLFKKDNPTGLPEHDATIAIPVTFAQ